MENESDTPNTSLSLPPLGSWVEEYLRKVDGLRERSSGTYFTSLAGCPLAWVLKRQGVKSDAMSPRGMETLTAGNEREDRTLQILAKSGHPLLGAGDIPLLGLPSDVQERVTVEIGEGEYKTTFSGRLDGCLYWQGVRVLVEIKTFSTRQWAKFLKTGPSRRYKVQTMFYMQALGMNKACIMGQCRDTEERAERWVFYDQALVDEVNRDFSRALAVEASLGQQPTEEMKANALAALGWCSGHEETYYTIKDPVTEEQRPAKTGMMEAYQEHGEGFPAGYCEVAYACPLLKKDGYKRVLKEGVSPGWFSYKGDEFNETLKAKAASRQRRPAKEFYDK